MKFIEALNELLDCGGNSEYDGHQEAVRAVDLLIASGKLDAVLQLESET